MRPSPKTSPRYQSREAAALALVLALTLAACGGKPYGSAYGSEDSVPAQEAGNRGNAYATVKTWLTACAEEEGAVVAEILTTPVQDVLYKAPTVLTGCERVAELAPGPDPPPEKLKRLFEKATIEHVRVEGGFGTATVRSPLGTTSELELERSMGTWAISNPPLLPVPIEEGGERAEAYAVVDAWLTACAEGEAAAAGEILTASARDTFDAAPTVLAGCERVANLVPARNPGREELIRAFDDATIEQVRVEAGSGTAALRSPPDTTSELPLRRSGDTWALSGSGPR